MQYKAIDNRLGRQLSDPRIRRKTFGLSRARRIAARLDEFAAAQNLTDISHYPPARLHALVGDKDGLFAVDISANYRLLFVGYTATNIQTKNEADIVKVMFVSVEDYH